MISSHQHPEPSGTQSSTQMPVPLEQVTRSPIEELRYSASVRPGQVLDFAIESYTDSMEVKNASLLQVRAIDSNGVRVPIPNWPEVSARVDEYIYLRSADSADPALKRFSVTIPDDAVELRIIGHRWHSRTETTVIGALEVFHEQPGVPPFRTALGTRLEWSASVYRQMLDIPPGVDEFSVDILVAGVSTEAKSPLLFRFLSSTGAELPPPEELPQSPTLGAYRYLTAAHREQERNLLTTKIPDGAATIVVEGAEWPSKLAVIADQPRFSFTNTSDVESVLNSLLDANEDCELIVIDTTAPPLGHETLSLRPNNLSIEYNRAGVSVLFVPFGSLQDHDPIVRPGLAQLGRSGVPSLIDKLVERRKGKRNTYICSSFPSLECVTRAEYLKREGWRTVYEVRDDMEEFNRVGYSKWYHPLLERKLLEIADVRVTVSEALTRKMSVMAPSGAGVATIPNGVAQTTLDNSVALRSDEQLGERNNSNVIGYVGHLTSSWFDWSLLTAAAKRLPIYDFEIVGHGKPAHIQLPTNVEYLGSMSHEELLPYASRWRVGLIPFISSPLTRGVDPNKIYEYFAWGMRVVTAPMGSVHQYPSTWVYDSLEEFVDCLVDSMSSPMQVEELAEIRRFAEASSWRDRAMDMLSLIEGGHK